MAGADALGQGSPAEAPPWTRGGSCGGSGPGAPLWKTPEGHQDGVDEVKLMFPAYFGPNANGSGRAIRFPGSFEDFVDLDNPDHSLEVLVKQGLLAELDGNAVEYNLQFAEEEICGGEARVHLLRWRLAPGLPAGGLGPVSVEAAPGSAPRALGIPVGMHVAVKVYHCPRGGGRGFIVLDSDRAKADEAEWGRRCVRREVKVLELLSHLDGAGSLTTPLAIFRRELPEPLFGYVMPASFYGSLNSLLRSTCQRLVPEATFAHLFSPARLAAQHAKLLRTLCHINGAELPGCDAVPAEHAVLLQDVSSNNILVDADGGLRLSDPSQAQLVNDLMQAAGTAKAPRLFQATWLWGSLAHRYRVTGHTQCDQTADLKALSVSFLDAWAVGEGSLKTLQDEVHAIRADDDLGCGLAFERALCVAILKRRYDGRNKGIVPRGTRELVVSALDLWRLLLGCEDYRDLQQLQSGLRHRRPSGPALYELATRLASITAQAEALDDLSTARVLETLPGAALVRDCVALYRQLCDLTRLNDPALLPPDEPLTWLATHFLDLPHPLAAAMAALGAVPLQGGPPLACPHVSNFSFHTALTEAKFLAKWDGGPAAVDDANEMMHLCRQRMRDLGKEYRRFEAEALRLVPDGPARAQLERSAALPPELEHAMRVMKLPKPLAPAPAAPAPGATQQPAGEPSAAAAAACTAASGQQTAPAPAPQPAAAATQQQQPPPAAAERPATAAGRTATADQHSAPAPAPGPAPSATEQQPSPHAATLWSAAPAAAAAATAGGHVAHTSAALSAPHLPTSQPPSTGERGSHLPPPSARPAPLAAASHSGQLPDGPPSTTQQGGTLAAPAMPGSGSSDGSTGGLTAALGTGLQAGAAAATQPSSDAGMTAAGHACSDRSAGADGHVPGASSPNKRKRSEQQQGSKAAARKAAGKTLTRFKPTYRDVAESVGAFDLDLLGRIHHSRVYVLTTRNLAALFMDKTHAQLDSKQGPYTSLAAAHPGLDLPALLCRFQCGRQYLEVSASFASPDPARFEACAPVVFSKQARSGGSDADLWVDSSLLDAAPAELLDDYYAGVRELIKTGKGQPAPPSGLLHVSFRLGSAALPAGAAAPWVQYAWQCDPAVCELLHNEAAEFVK